MKKLKEYVFAEVEITEIFKSDIITTSGWHFDEDGDVNADANGWT